MTIAPGVPRPLSAGIPPLRHIPGEPGAFGAWRNRRAGLVKPAEPRHHRVRTMFDGRAMRRGAQHVTIDPDRASAADLDRIERFRGYEVVRFREERGDFADPRRPDGGPAPSGEVDEAARARPPFAL